MAQITELKEEGRAKGHLGGVLYAENRGHSEWGWWGTVGSGRSALPESPVILLKADLANCNSGVDFCQLLQMQ